MKKKKERRSRRRDSEGVQATWASRLSLLSVPVSGSGSGSVVSVSITDQFLTLGERIRQQRGFLSNFDETCRGRPTSPSSRPGQLRTGASRRFIGRKSHCRAPISRPPPTSVPALQRDMSVLWETARHCAVDAEIEIGAVGIAPVTTPAIASTKDNHPRSSSFDPHYPIRINWLMVLHPGP